MMIQTKIQCPRCKTEPQPGQILHMTWAEEWMQNSLDSSYYADYEWFWCGLCDGHAEVDPNHEAICEQCRGTGSEFEDGIEVDCSGCEGLGYDIDLIPTEAPVDSSVPDCPECGSSRVSGFLNVSGWWRCDKCQHDWREQEEAL